MPAPRSPDHTPTTPEAQARELSDFLDEYGIGEDLLPRDFLRRQLPPQSRTVHNAPQCSTSHHPTPSAKRSHPPEWQPHDPPPITPSPHHPTSSLTPRQLHAAHLLTAGHNDSSAAAILGVHRHTLRRWRRLPAFIAELHRLLPPPTQGSTPP